jgi:acyl carrier protein
MIPSQIIVLNELPRLANFKIDRARLAEMDDARSVDMSDRSQDPLLDEVAGIFETVIGVSGVTADDTVASIGGDSLQAITLVSELERRYGVSIPSDLIAEGPTIRKTANWIRSKIPDTNWFAEIKNA